MLVSMSKALVGHQLDFSVFDSLSIVFSNRALLSEYGEHPIALAIARGVRVVHEIDPFGQQGSM